MWALTTTSTVMDASEAPHEQAKAEWVRLMEAEDDIVCNSYVLLETHALVQR